MASEVNAFITNWLHDVERVLRRKLESSKEHLLSDDESEQDAAASLVSQILDWLYPPSNTPISDEHRLLLMQQVMGIADAAERNKAMLRIARTTGRRKGRPRDESSQYAIRALTLRRSTNKSWREIALELRGCEHERPNPERSCPACGEKMRQAVMRLERFLTSQGLDPAAR
jgi:hypothetical protein